MTKEISPKVRNFATRLARINDLKVPYVEALIYAWEAVVDHSFSMVEHFKTPYEGKTLELSPSGRKGMSLLVYDGELNRTSPSFHTIVKPSNNFRMLFSNVDGILLEHPRYFLQDQTINSRGYSPLGQGVEIFTAKYIPNPADLKLFQGFMDVVLRLPVIMEEFANTQDRAIDDLVKKYHP